MIEYKRKKIISIVFIITFFIIIAQIIMGVFKYDNKENDLLTLKNRILKEKKELIIMDRKLDKFKKSKKIIINSLLDKKKFEKELKEFIQIIEASSLIKITNFTIDRDKQFINKLIVSLDYSKDEFLNRNIIRILLTKMSNNFFTDYYINTRVEDKISLTIIK